MPTAFQRPAAALRRRSLPWLLALLLPALLSPLLPLPAQAQPVPGAGLVGAGSTPWVAEVELGVGLQLSASAPSVRQPNGEYRETHIDLRVNALGGPIDIARSWSQGRWWLNPAWAPLNFELDPLDGSARVIERAGLIYERSGSSELFISKANSYAPVFIRKICSKPHSSQRKAGNPTTGQPGKQATASHWARCANPIESSAEICRPDTQNMPQCVQACGGFT